MSHTKPVATTIGLLTGLSLVVAGGDADALTMTQMKDFGDMPDLAADTGTVGAGTHSAAATAEVDSFALFDSDMGTLTGVKFTIDTTKAEGLMSFSAFVEDGTVDGSGIFAAEFFATVSGGPNIADTMNRAFEFMDSVENSCSGTESCSPMDTTFSNNAMQFDDMLVVGGGNISTFASSGGGMFDITYSLPIEYELAVEGAEASIEGSANADWEGKMIIEYTYDPVAVPEPASWSLLGLGLAGVAAMRRRKHKASAAQSRRKPAARN